MHYKFVRWHRFYILCWVLEQHNRVTDNILISYFYVGIRSNNRFSNDFLNIKNTLYSRHVWKGFTTLLNLLGFSFLRCRCNQTFPRGWKPGLFELQFINSNEFCLIYVRFHDIIFVTEFHLRRDWIVYCKWILFIDFCFTDIN